MSDEKKFSLPTTVEGIIALAGCVLILIAFVNYDIPQGRIIVRAAPSYAMLAVGAALLIVALIAYSMTQRSSNAATTSVQAPAPAPAPVPAPPPQVTVNVDQRVVPKMSNRQHMSAGQGDGESGSRSGGHEGGDTAPKRHQAKALRYPPGIDKAQVDGLAAAIHSLSGTQKDLMVFFYSLHRPNLSLDEAYVFLEKAQAGRLGNKDELYFRLKDLKSKELIGLATQSRNVSFIQLRPDVAATLEALDLLPSGGD